YVLAFAAAMGTTWVYILLTDTPDKQMYSGMAAFGDMILFLCLWGGASLPATSAGLFFLRDYRPIWVLFAAAAATIGATGFAAMVVLFSGYMPSDRSWL